MKSGLLAFGVLIWAAPVFAPLETMMERLREADGLAFETEGD